LNQSLQEAIHRVISAAEGETSIFCPLLKAYDGEITQKGLKERFKVKELDQILSFLDLSRTGNKNDKTMRIANVLAPMGTHSDFQPVIPLLSTWFCEPFKVTNDMKIGLLAENSLRRILSTFLKEHVPTLRHSKVFPMGLLVRNDLSVVSTSVDGIVFLDDTQPFVVEFKTRSSTEIINRELQIKQQKGALFSCGPDSVHSAIFEVKHRFQVLHHLCCTGLPVIYVEASNSNNVLKIIRCVVVTMDDSFVETFLSVMKPLNTYLQSSNILNAVPEEKRSEIKYAAQIANGLECWSKINNLPIPQLKRVNESIISYYNLGKTGTDSLSRLVINSFIEHSRIRTLGKFHLRLLLIIVVASVNLFKAYKMAPLLLQNNIKTFKAYQHKKNEIGATRTLLGLALRELSPEGLGVLREKSVNMGTTGASATQKFSNDQINAEINKMLQHKRSQKIRDIFNQSKILIWLRKSHSVLEEHEEVVTPLENGKNQRMTCILCCGQCNGKQNNIHHNFKVQRTFKSCSLCKVPLCVEPRAIWGNQSCFSMFHKMEKVQSSHEFGGRYQNDQVINQDDEDDDET
jgi:hypothetical protein